MNSPPAGRKCNAIATFAGRNRNRMKRPTTTPENEADEPQIDFDELTGYVGYQVRRTQAKIFADFDATLKDFDFTPGSFGVLTLIRANPGITQVALAAAFGIDKVHHEPGDLPPGEPRPRPPRGAGQRPPPSRAVLRGAAEPTFLAAREKVRAFEASVAARLTKTEQRELARLLAKLQGRAAAG